MSLENTLLYIIRIGRQLERPTLEFMLKRHQGAAGMGGFLATWTKINAEFPVRPNGNMGQGVIHISLYATFINRRMLLGGQEPGLAQNDHSTETGKYEHLPPGFLNIFYQG